VPRELRAECTRDPLWRRPPQPARPCDRRRSWLEFGRSRIPLSDARLASRSSRGHRIS